jgi:DNA primase large subunit
VLRANSIDCQPLSKKDNTEKFQRFMRFRKTRSGAGGGGAAAVDSVDAYFSTPLALATKLIKDRAVLCVGGRAIVGRQEALEVLLASFRAVVARGLHDCFLSRAKLQGLGEDAAEESGLAHVSVMLDAFLQKFVAEPTDRATVASEGSVRASDVQLLAATHFPLCMRRIDRHLRTEGHLRHTGRFSYGLFLKQIGLSKDDAMILFSSLMTVKGGGSMEAFAKSEYGYNVRHNYGLEGKKTSYSSMSCATIVAQPPSIDRHDCHGCPFRFREESVLRALLGEAFPSPVSADAPRQRLLPSDIEDIVKDAREMHYTRACFRYFVAVHPNAKRDTLFRSPGEYFEVSREVKKQYAAAEGKPVATAAGDGQQEQGGGEEATPGRSSFTGQATKRSLIPTDPVERVIRPRTEES